MKSLLSRRDFAVIGLALLAASAAGSGPARAADPLSAQSKNITPA